MIAPACFDPDASDETSRGLDNVRHIRGIWLDNDGGDLTYQEFADCFRICAWPSGTHTATHLPIQDGACSSRRRWPCPSTSTK